MEMEKTMNTQKPMFNVNPGFLGMFLITFNDQMKSSIMRIVYGNLDMIGDDTEIKSFAAALNSPESHLVENSPSYIVDNPLGKPFPFCNSIVIKFNEEMCLLFADFISDVAEQKYVEPQVMAFMQALNNPMGKPEQAKRRRKSMAYGN